MAKQLRVAVLYRASTKKQQKKSISKTRNGKVSARKSVIEDDLPLQRIKCEQTIQEHGWIFTGIEYIEGGVSGFHDTTCATQRGL
jgi:site-specific DNA recombinase